MGPCLTQVGLRTVLQFSIMTVGWPMLSAHLPCALQMPEAVQDVVPAALFVPENDENKPQPKVGARAQKGQTVVLQQLL